MLNLREDSIMVKVLHDVVRIDFYRPEQVIDYYKMQAMNNPYSENNKN